MAREKIKTVTTHRDTLYRAEKRIFIDADTIYLTNIDDNNVILSVKNGLMVHSANITRDRIDRMINAVNNGITYEFSEEIPMIHGVSGLSYISYAELVIKADKNTKIKEYE